MQFQALNPGRHLARCSYNLTDGELVSKLPEDRFPSAGFVNGIKLHQEGCSSSLSFFGPQSIIPIRCIELRTAAEHTSRGTGNEVLLEGDGTMKTETSTKTGTILVIDDEEAVTGVIQAVLSKEGYQVHLAHNGAEGLKLAGQVKPDLIIMDITMPGMDGYEATKQLKHDPSLAEIPIIFLTGKSAGEDGGKAFAAGGVSFVRKPFSSQQLRDLVALAMESLRE